MRKDLNIKIIVTVCLTLCISFLISFTKPYSSYSKNKFDWFWVNKTHYSGKADIIILGDSRTYRGVSPSAMNNVLPNKKVLNLGYSSAGLTNEYFDFSLNHLNTNNSSIILIGVTPFCLTDDARDNKHLHQELNRPLAEVIERKYIYPYSSLFESIKLTDYYPNKSNPIYYQTFHTNGWAESYKIPNNPNEALPIYKKELAESNINQNSVNETLNFVKKATERGIKVFGFRPPSTTKMEQLENNLINFDYPKFITQFEANGGTWISLPSSNNFNSYDGSHLHFESAKKLSTILAKKINQE